MQDSSNFKISAGFALRLKTRQHQPSDRTPQYRFQPLWSSLLSKLPKWGEAQAAIQPISSPLRLRISALSKYRLTAYPYSANRFKHCFPKPGSFLCCCVSAAWPIANFWRNEYETIIAPHSGNYSPDTAALTFSANSAFAQAVITAAQLNGTVRDASGSVIDKARTVSMGKTSTPIAPILAYIQRVGILRLPQSPTRALMS